MGNDQEKVVCPSCLSVNRVRVDRPAEAARCGRCHQPLFTGKPVVLEGESFDKHIGKSDVPVLVDFWAEWCAPCRMMAPAFEQAAGVLEPRVRLAKLNTESNQYIAARYGIRSIPTLVLFKEGREVDRVSGAMDRDALVRWVQGHIPA